MQPLPITMYTAPDCPETTVVRDCLHRYSIAFTEIDISGDAESAKFVRMLNNGFESTPTLIIGSSKVKLVLTEPTPEQLKASLIDAGYDIA